MPNEITLSVAQLKAGPVDPQFGLKRHLEYIEQAKCRASDLLVFPELSLVGYDLQGRVQEVALDINDDVIQRISETAKGIAVTFSFIEKDHSARYFNTSLTVKDGDILNIHRKINLATYGALEEGKHFARGEEINAFSPFEDQGNWKACSLICADHWNPLLLSLAALRGANLLLSPIASAEEAVGDRFSNPDSWRQNLGNTALTFGSYIAMSNWIGPQGDLNFWGGSCIVSPNGKVITAASDDECLISANIDYAEVPKQRYLLPTLRDMDPHHFCREFKRKS